MAIWILVLIALAVLFLYQRSLTARSIKQTEEALACARVWQKRAEETMGELILLLDGHKVWPDSYWRRAKEFVTLSSKGGSASDKDTSVKNTSVN